MFRRGACPGLLDPMETGDGLLARLPLARMPLPAFAGLCAAAEAHGNGVIEVTARGSVQIRGLRTGTIVPFADAVAALGIEVPEGPTVIVNPLVGLDPTETADVSGRAAELHSAIAAAPFAASLAPKISVVVDGGGALHLDALAADIRLRALPDESLLVALGGDGATATALGRVRPEDASAAVVGLLAAIAAIGPTARGRDLGAAEAAAALCAAAVAVAPAGESRARTPAEPIGRHLLRDGRVAIGFGLAFGHGEAAQLRDLCRSAASFGATSVAPAERRSLLVIGLPEEAADAFAAAAERLGFVVRAEDPRRNVVACAGAPACAAAQMPARTIAPAVVEAARPLMDGSLTLHLSGCAKGCAHPGAAMLTFVGVEAECSVVLDGSVRTTSVGTLAPGSLVPRLARLAIAVGRARRPGERAADALARLGRDRVAALILEDAGT
jgi:precorrin-3B synthase